MVSDIKLSIIIVTYNRLQLLWRCLESIAVSILPETYETIVIINGDNETTARFLNTIPFINLNLKFYSVGKTTNAAARNEGIKYAKGGILYFLDDDVAVKEDIFKEAIGKFQHYPDVEIIGGCNLTPTTSNLFQRCSGYALASIFGAANMRRRWAAIGEDKLTGDNSLILCSLAARKRIFDGGKAEFNRSLTCAEENLLIQQLKAEGHKVLYCPKLVVYHERRKSLLGFARQIFKYGRGRAQQTLCLPRSLPLLNIFPSLFILYLASLIFFHSRVYLSPLLLYLLLDLIFSAHISSKNKSIESLPLLFILFIVEHIAYGLGFFYGFLRRFR